MNNKEILTGQFKEGVKYLEKFKGGKDDLIFLNGQYLLKLAVSTDDNIFTILKYDLIDDTGIKANLNNKQLKSISNIKEEYISFSQEGEKLIVNSNKRKITLETGNSIEDIEIPQEKINDSFMVKIDELKELLQTTDFASKDNVRPILKGVCISSKREFASLDGYRLAVRKNDNIKIDGEYVVLSDTLKALKGINKNKNTTFEFGQRYCKIAFGDLEIYSRLLEGAFIKYNQLIPNDYNTMATLNLKELQEENNYLMDTYEDKNRTITTFNFINGNTTIENIDVAKVEIKLEKSTYKNDCRIALSGKYLKESLKHFEIDDEVELYIKNSISPMVIKSKNINGLDMILPVRLTNKSK